MDSFLPSICPLSLSRERERWLSLAASFLHPSPLSVLSEPPEQTGEKSTCCMTRRGMKVGARFKRLFASEHWTKYCHLRNISLRVSAIQSWSWGENVEELRVFRLEGPPTDARDPNKSLPRPNFVDSLDGGGGGLRNSAELLENSGYQTKFTEFKTPLFSDEDGC